MKLTQKDFISIFEMALAIVVAGSMFLYGIGKPMQFTNVEITQKIISQLTGMELMWAFYGHSKAYVLVVGFFEILGALLILIPKTRILGCLITTTILFNVILQDIFYEVNFGALIAAITYQICVLIILAINKNIIISTLRHFFMEIMNIPKNKNWIINVFLACLGAVALKALEAYFTH